MGELVGPLVVVPFDVVGYQPHLVEVCRRICMAMTAVTGFLAASFRRV